MPTFNFKTSSGTDLGNLNLGWITKDYLMSVYPQIANQLITPELWMWGGNSYGVNGHNFASGFTSIPITTFAGGANWKQVSCGGLFTSAIKTDGTLWVWGRNLQGQLGNNAPPRHISTPVTTFAGGTNWNQVACGPVHTAAIKTDGTLWVWGRNNQGQLGNNTTTDRSTPVTTFVGGNNWKQVSCAYHTTAIKTDGTLWTWGFNLFGQLGNNTATQRNTPVTTFAGGTDWKQVSSGLYHTLAIKTDGTLWVWGSNYLSKLGINTTINKSTPVTTFAGGTDWKQTDGGGNFTAAIKTDGTLWTWGQNTFGQLGNNTTTQRDTPVTTFAGGTNWKQVACGYHNTAAIKTNGTLWMWGANSYGQLGNATITNRSFPVTTFAGGTNWKQVNTMSYSITSVAAIKTSDDLQGI